MTDDQFKRLEDLLERLIAAQLLAAAKPSAGIFNPPSPEKIKEVIAQHGAVVSAMRAGRNG